MGLVTVNSDYIFNSKAVGVDNEITETHYEDGRLSNEIWDSHDFWSELNGTEVTVISVIAIKKKIGSCDEWAKVFIKSHGFEWWFSVRVNELSPVGSSNNLSAPGSCRCDLRLIMIRGCQCGGS